MIAPQYFFLCNNSFIKSNNKTLAASLILTLLCKLYYPK